MPANPGATEEKAFPPWRAVGGHVALPALAKASRPMSENKIMAGGSPYYDSSGPKFHLQRHSIVQKRLLGDHPKPNAPHTHTHTARKNRTYTKHLVRGCHDQGNIPELNTFPFQINVTGWTCRNPRSRRTQFWNNALCGPKSFCPSFLPTYFSKEGKKCIPPRVFAACRCQKVRFSVNFYVV